MNGFLGWALLTAALAASACASAAAPKWTKVALTQNPDQPLLSGRPETAGMRSGHVTLAPGADMHRHTTQHNEELLVVLHGHARLQVADDTVQAQGGEVVYIPPDTWHAVHNDGAEPLEYIFVVAPAR